MGSGGKHSKGTCGRVWCGRVRLDGNGSCALGFQCPVSVRPPWKIRPETEPVSRDPASVQSSPWLVQLALPAATCCSAQVFTLLPGACSGAHTAIGHAAAETT